METEGVTIVLADDDADLRAMYGHCLRRAGYVVVEAADGRQAIEAVRARRPSLLLLDLWMPGAGGFEVLERLRGESGPAGLKVVMLSCVTDADARLECFAAGADAYLVKGLSLDDLLAHVAEALAGGPARGWAIEDEGD